MSNRADTRNKASGPVLNLRASFPLVMPVGDRVTPRPAPILKEKKC